ncbi:MAG: lipid-A-disaccharide synthase [candidate division Zixibacteria bacterium]|nr:lipid-A-disaccharide synthase [candidate division Zixibacteria bacterium]
MSTRRVMIMAGEASGELHGAGVVRAIKSRDPETSVFGVGGERMKTAGCELIYPIERFAFMGFVEVIRHLPFIRSALRRLERLIRERRPQVLILIDYPDFNLRLARIARRLGVPVLYYISPQVWAWRAGRIHDIIRLVDVMAVVFPFETALYEKAGGRAVFVGHPLLEELETRWDREEFCRRAGLDPSRPIVGLLPGSRKQEISRLLPPLSATIARIRDTLPDVQGVVGLAPTISRDLALPLLDPDATLVLVEGMTYEVMQHADLLIVASGTATLESACFGTPLLVVYRLARINWWIARRLVAIPDIGLVNVVAGRRIAPEFLQDEVNSERLSQAALALLDNPTRLEEMRVALREVRTRLGSAGASEKVAQLAFELARSDN